MRTRKPQVTRAEPAQALPQTDGEKYRVARTEAQRRADQTGFDHGVMRNAFGFSAFMLPRRENRYGHELRCEVVSCMDASRAQAGHGGG